MLISRNVNIVGLAGFYPIHPTSYMTAWRNRQIIAKKKAQEEQEKLKESASTEGKVE